MTVSRCLRFRLLGCVAAIALSAPTAHTQADVVDPAKNNRPNPNPPPNANGRIVKYFR